MGAVGVAQFQLRRHPFQGDGVNAAVVLGDERPRPLRVAAATGAPQMQVLTHKALGFAIGALAAVDDENVLHSSYLTAQVRPIS